MQFSSFILAAFAAVVAAENIVEFVNQDSTTRSVVFTAATGSEAIQTLEIKGYSLQNVTFPQGWNGNWWSMSEGAAYETGMLAEVAWNAYDGITFFDVSAIVNPKDNVGVKMLFPKISASPLSGCQEFPCDNVYNQPDDHQTLSTSESTLVCLLGTPSLGPALVRRHPRHFLAHAAAIKM